MPLLQLITDTAPTSPSSAKPSPVRGRRRVVLDEEEDEEGDKGELGEESEAEADLESLLQACTRL